MAIPGIQEIQALATKYSKPQLQKMAQMGLVDPTKAVMAGMMILCLKALLLLNKHLKLLVLLAYRQVFLRRWRVAGSLRLLKAGILMVMQTAVLLATKMRVW
jgi:hypothetical protein